MNRHEENICKFFIKSKRERYFDFLKSPKKRSKFTNKLSHFKDFEPSMIIKLEKIDREEGKILKLLNDNNAPANCYIISENPNFDQIETSLEEALNMVYAQGFASIISCVPGKVAYYEAERSDDSHLLILK